LTGTLGFFHNSPVGSSSGKVSHHLQFYPTHLSSGHDSDGLNVLCEKGWEWHFHASPDRQLSWVVRLLRACSPYSDWLVVPPYLIWLPDSVKWDPCCSYQGVPDESFTPHLHNQTQVQTIYLTWVTDRHTEIEIRPSTNMHTFFVHPHLSVSLRHFISVH